MSLFTSKNPFQRAIRQALIGALAASAPFLVGKLLGVAVS
jgi:VIT1/CCC1 family predicted Fe2+/Mn2+ transporter